MSNKHNSGLMQSWWRLSDSLSVQCLVLCHDSLKAHAQSNLQTYRAIAIIPFLICEFRRVCCLLIVSEAHIQTQSWSLWILLQGETWTCMRIIWNQSTADCLTIVTGRSRNLLFDLGNRRNTGKTQKALLGIMHEPELESRLEIQTVIGVRMESVAVPLSTRMIMKMSRTRIGLSRRQPLCLHEEGGLGECPAAPCIEQVCTHSISKSEIALKI